MMVIRSGRERQAGGGRERASSPGTIPDKDRRQTHGRRYAHMQTVLSTVCICYVMLDLTDWTFKFVTYSSVLGRKTTPSNWF